VFIVRSLNYYGKLFSQGIDPNSKCDQLLYVLIQKKNLEITEVEYIKTHQTHR